jgi:DivIVA domain-containing protein
MEQIHSIDRIRSATFTIARRGYEKRDVERFLNQLADWLETGAGDEERANTLRRELEKIGERTTTILTAVHAAAEEMQGEAERAATQIKQTVREETQLKRAEADGYSKETRTSADGYAAKERAAADGYSAKTRSGSESYATELRASTEREAEGIEKHARKQGRETVEAAESEGERLIAEGRKRRSGIEAVISDLVARRDAVLDDIDRLTGDLRSAIGAHSKPSAEPGDSETPRRATRPSTPALKPAAKVKRPAAGARSAPGHSSGDGGTVSPAAGARSAPGNSSSDVGAGS